MKRQYWIASVYLVFLVTGIPWYWPDNTTSLVLGLPVWFFVAILVSICASLFTAFILLRYSWDTEIKPDEE
jgi:hypothetical protein